MDLGILVNEGQYTQDSYPCKSMHRLFPFVPMHTWGQAMVTEMFLQST